MMEDERAPSFAEATAGKDDTAYRLHHEAFSQLHADPDKKSGRVSSWAVHFV